VLIGAAVSTAGLDIFAAARSAPFLFGTTQFGLGLVFLTVGDHMVSATENALINPLETLLGRCLDMGLLH
jgi:hypothetical protein